MDVFSRSHGFNVFKLRIHSKCCRKLWVHSRWTSFYPAILLQFGINSCSIIDSWRSFFIEVIFSAIEFLLICNLAMRSFFHALSILWKICFRLRSFLCGLTLAIRYGLAALATKSYYNLELWLTMPGAILFYGIISLIGYELNRKLKQ